MLKVILLTSLIASSIIIIKEFCKKRFLTDVEGFSFFVNTSEKACLEFGFGYNQELIDPYGLRATTKGVSRLPNGQKVIWLARPNEDGRVNRWTTEDKKEVKNLKEEGFKLATG